MSGYYPDPPPEAVGLAQPGPDDVDEFRAIEGNARRLGRAHGLREAAWEALTAAQFWDTCARESVERGDHMGALNSQTRADEAMALAHWHAKCADRIHNYDDNRPRPYGDEE